MRIYLMFDEYEFATWIDLCIMLEHLNLYNRHLYYVLPDKFIVYGSPFSGKTTLSKLVGAGDVDEILRPDLHGRLITWEEDRKSDFVLLLSNRCVYDHFRCDYRSDVDMWRLRSAEFFTTWCKAKRDSANIMFYNEHAVFTKEDCYNVLVLRCVNDDFAVVNANNMFAKHFSKIYNGIITEGRYKGR